MTNEERDIQRKLRVLQHAEKIGNGTVRQNELETGRAVS